MSYITKYGSFWGMVPQASGQVWWVAPAASYTVEGRSYSASDNNDGKSPERALLTLGQAITNCTASAGDVIVLLPGNHSWSATTSVSKAGITITGLPRGGEPREGDRMPAGGWRLPTTVVGTAADEIITVSAANVEFAHIQFNDVSAQACLEFDADGDNGFVHDCVFLFDVAANTATIGIQSAGAFSNLCVRRCLFHATVNAGPAIRTAHIFDGLLIEKNTFYLSGAAAWDDAIELTGTDYTGAIIRDNDFLQAVSGTVITDCIDIAGTTDGAHTILRNYHAVGSDLLEPANAADVQVAENYVMQTGGVSGGALVTG